MSLTEPHDEFLELCAASTSGQLTEAEHKRLQEHLATCQSCRRALKQFEAVVDQAIPAIGANEPSEFSEPSSSWSQERAERAFFDRSLQEEKGQAGKRENPSAISAGPHPSLHLPVTRPGAMCGCSVPLGFFFLLPSVSTLIGLA